MSLSTDYPAANLAQLQSSQKVYLDRLFNGQLTDSQAAAVLALFAAYMDPLYDTSAIAQPAGTFHGTAGSTTYKYVAFPSYPMNDPSGVIPPVLELPGPQPYGRLSPVAELLNSATPITEYRVRRYPGGTQALAAIIADVRTVASCAATLNGSNYVAVTAPNPSQNIAGVLYDICRYVAGSPPVFTLVKANVAPGVVVNDDGTPGYQVYTPYAHTEVAWDTTSVACYNVNSVPGIYG
jgi:hypothetical protein